MKTYDIEAIFRNGVFEPLQPIDLPEGQRVRLIVQRNEPFSKEAVDAWLKRVQARQATIMEREGLLPDNTPGIAADRLR